MQINETQEDFSSFLLSFLSFFSNECTFSLLTNSKLNLESGRLIRKRVDYRNRTEVASGTIIDVLPFQVFRLKLGNGSRVETHHNFILILLKQSKQTAFSKPLASELLDQISHDALLGIPTQKEALSADQKELLSWHYRLGHMSFKSLQKLVKLGLIPQNLSKVNPVPLCSSCTFAATKKRA